MIIRRYTTVPSSCSHVWEANLFFIELLIFKRYSKVNHHRATNYIEVVGREQTVS